MASQIVVEWFNIEKTIIKQTFKLGWTLPDYLEAVRIINQMTTTSDQLVSSISVFEGTLAIPKGFISTIPSVLNNVPANNGLTIMVGGGTLVATLVRLGYTLVPRHKRRVCIVQTVDEAVRLIRRELGDVLKSTP